MIRRSTTLALAAAAAFGVPPQLAAFAQATAGATAAAVDPQGDWVDQPAGGGAPRMALHIRREGAGLTGTLDVPSHGAFAVPLANVQAQGGTFSYEVPAVSGRYSGVWDGARGAYVGRWTSAQGSAPLVLARGTLPAATPVDWTAPAVAGLYDAPGPAAQARVGPALPVGKCVNMANMLEAPKEGDWGPAIADEDFRIIRAAGFSTVRIPVSWSTHAEMGPPYTIDPAFLRRVHHVVAAATAAGLNVILNDHHYNELMSDPAGNTARFAGLWKQIAASFADAPPSVWFELLNEPHDKLDNANLMSVLGPALRAVRATNPTRPVLIGGQTWSNLPSLDTLPLPDDPYVVPTFHYYEPFAFSSQGAKWVPNAPPPGRAYGSAADKAELDADVAHLKAWMAKTGRVPVMGEYGAIDDTGVPLEQRERYYRAISGGFASIGVQGCAWGFKNSFRLYDGRQWLPGMLDSIVTVTSR